jgi:excisionase family DNA binding protein
MPPITRDDLDGLLNRDEAAAYLHVGRSTMDRLISARAIDVVRKGSGRGRPYFTERALLDYLNRQIVKADR